MLVCYFVQKLAGAYDMLHKAYSRVVEVMRTGKRILGTYYRVAFYGAVRILPVHVYWLAICPTLYSTLECI